MNDKCEVCGGIMEEQGYALDNDGYRYVTFECSSCGQEEDVYIDELNQEF